MTLLLRMAPLLQGSLPAVSQGGQTRQRSRRARSRRRRSHWNTPVQYMGPAAGPDHKKRKDHYTSSGQPQTQSELPLPAATRAETELEAWQTWLNISSLTIWLGGTPGDEQTIPTRVHQNTRALLCSLLMLVTTQLAMLG